MIIVLIASVIMGLSDCRLKGFMTFDAGSLEGCCVVKDLVIRKARVLPDMRMVFGGSILCFLKDNASQTSIDLFVRISCNSFSSVFMNKNLKQFENYHDDRQFNMLDFSVLPKSGCKTCAYFMWRSIMSDIKFERPSVKTSGLYE